MGGGATPHQVRIGLLGPPRIERDGVVVRGFESRRAVDLLCYVAARGRPVPRRELATLFWGEKPDARARSNLSRVLYNLTHLLPDCLDVDRDTVALRGDIAWLDTVDFERQDAAGDPAALASAAELCRDEFMAAADVEDAGVFQEWLDGERQRWRRRAVSVLQRLTEHHLRRREYPAAEGYASRLLAIVPWSEEGHRTLMLALAGTGRRSEALKQFETCRQVLAAELGVEPAVETQALWHRIGAAAGRQRHNLPANATALVDREREMAEIAERLADPDCRLLVLLGPAGIGKTRLALAAAERQADAFLDGVHFAPVAAVDSRPGLVAAIADAVGFSFHERGTAEDQICNYLADKVLLLVLDSFEHLLPAGEDFLSTVLARAPGVKLLVTSRQRLNAGAEWLLEVGGLDYPRDESRDIDAFPAVRLFRQAAVRANQAFALAPDEGPVVARACRTVEGMPLAIELAAAWVRSLSCREIATELERDAATLTDHGRVPHHDLQALFHDSWALLSADEQTAFAQLSVCAGGFEREAAVAIAQASATLLAGLIDKSFLRRDPSGRYGMHELLRQYGLARLAASPDAQRSARDRHAAHFLGLLHDRRDIFGPRHKEVLSDIGSDFANVRAAWAWALERRLIREIAGCADSVLMYLELRSRWGEGIELFGQAVASLEAAAAAPEAAGEVRAVLGSVHAHLGWCLHRAGDVPRATASFHRSVELLRAFGSRPVRASPFYFTGIAAWLSGDNAQAEALLSESLAAATEAGALWYASLASSMLGYVACGTGRFERARECLDEGLQLSQVAGAPIAQAFALLGLGRLAAAKGQYTEARPLMEASLTISRRIEHQFGLAFALMELGAVAQQTGDLADAKRFLEESLAGSTEMGERWGVSRALMGLGALAAAQGEAGAATKHFREAGAQAIAAQAPPLMMDALLGLAEVIAARGDAAPAARMLGIVLHNASTESRTREQATALWARLGAGALPEPASPDSGRPLAETVQELLDLGALG